MKKYPIGFKSFTKKSSPDQAIPVHKKEVTPRKSVVKVYFPHRGTGWAYYNDSFDLKVGDFVYVDGKLEGYRGQVTEVNYSFKIKLSDYKKVIAVVDTNIKGELHLAASHVVSFERTVIPFSKIVSWFKAPEENAEYASGSDDERSFPLEDLTKLNVSPATAECGHDYYVENKVSYIELDKHHGKAIVEGNESYIVEFIYDEGEISNLTCSCF